MLVAFTLATLLLAVLLRGVGQGVAGSRRVATAADATILAESTLDAMGVVAPLRDGDAADRSVGPFRVRVSVARYHDSANGGEDGYVVPYELTATVLWQEGRLERSMSLRTVRLGPPR
jgi:hypothetical protein